MIMSIRNIWDSSGKISVYNQRSVVTSTPIFFECSAMFNFSDVDSTAGNESSVTLCALS